MTRQLTEDVVKERLKNRPIVLITMGETINDPYTFLCTENESHGEWSVRGANVLSPSILSGCPKCWQERRKSIRQREWNTIGGNR